MYGALLRVLLKCLTHTINLQHKEKEIAMGYKNIGYLVAKTWLVTEAQAAEDIRKAEAEKADKK